MSFGFGPANAQMAFLQQEFFLPDSFEESKDIISNRENRTASALNIREIGQYETVELLNAQTWFSTNRQNIGQSQQTRYGFRRTFDLVAINGGPIPLGTTNFIVSPPIVGISIPTKAFGSATIAGPNYIFFPSTFIDITFNNVDPNRQIIVFSNLSLSVLTQCYLTIEYLKQP